MEIRIVLGAALALCIGFVVNSVDGKSFEEDLTLTINEKRILDKVSERKTIRITKIIHWSDS
jgi:hypothetical protein